MSQAKYTVGIDLGTTHCAMGYRLRSEEAASLESFAIPQVVSAGNVEARPLLPSFLYLPGPELAAGSGKLPWDENRDHIVGEFARSQGSTVPLRLVSSAKSWLGHAGVDRRSNILPWDAPAEVQKVSPLEASARYLRHLREAWDHTHPEAPLASQEIFLTVPASFDTHARDLTVDAAREAGLAKVTLLEEPQAALYAWLASQGERWRKELSVGDVILVVDVGGGTSDFSLVVVGQEEGQLALQRVAVGDHILLGGDNMDLALAYTVDARLKEQGKTLDPWQFRILTYACRQAKEKLLSDDAPESMPIVIPGRGSSLVGKSIRTELSKTDVQTVLVEGFFPMVAVGDKPAERKRAGLAQLGLPYASDAALSRHLAAFLSRHATVAAGKGEKGFLAPTAVLFNGGVLNAAAIQKRVLDQLTAWSGKAPKLLQGTSLDLAVAKGAAYYGYARSGKGVRIRGGTARAYYIGIESTMPAVPGYTPPVQALCVAPFGMEEGSHVSLPEHELALIVGEPAEFRFFSSSTRRDDKAGALVPDAKILEELPPIETTLEGEAGKVTPVRLEASLTELGTLELWCVERAQQRWKLECSVRLAGQE